ncbi:MAG: RNase adapter RapZ, partial [Candidatus Limnocylindrales bacterium]
MVASDERRDGKDASAADAAADPTPHVVLLSGVSGGGKTAAAKLFEDLGYVVVDNLPSDLLPELAELVSSDPERYARVAIVLDIRSGD